MNNLMSFVVNTGTPEGDQYEIARYQQYYQAYGVALAAQPQAGGGFLLTTYQSQPPSPQEAQAPQQYGNGSHPEPAAPQQYGLATQAGYGAPQQYGAPAAQGTPQPFGVGTQAGYGAPQQYSAASQAPPLAPQAQAYGVPQQAQAYGAPQQAQAYGVPQQAQAYGAPQQAQAYGAPQQAQTYGAPEQAQQYGSAPAAAPAYGAPQAQPYAGSPQAHPYGSGFGSESPAPAAVPAAPWGMPAATPARRSGGGSRFSLMQKLKFAGSAVVVLGLAGWSFFLMRQVQSNIVLFENSLDVPGELSIAGKAYGSIAPRQAMRLELDAGSHEVSFTGNGTKLDGGTLNVPKGNGAIGYRAVYNLGGRPGIAVVTKYYGGSFEDRVVPVAEGTRVVEVPGAQTLDRIDAGFPDTITVPKHASYGTLVHVCHVDEQKGTVGCPGW